VRKQSYTAHISYLYIHLSVAVTLRIDTMKNPPKTISHHPRPPSGPAIGVTSTGLSQSDTTSPTTAKPSSLEPIPSSIAPTPSVPDSHVSYAPSATRSPVDLSSPSTHTDLNELTDLPTPAATIGLPNVLPTAMLSGTGYVNASRSVFNNAGRDLTIHNVYQNLGRTSSLSSIYHSF
jgi:hypothetical protein